MNLGEFKRKITRLNKNLRIFTRDTGKPAGICLLFDGEYVNICSIDKNYIPMLPIRGENGQYIKGGWRRALKMLIDRRLIDCKQAENEFRCGLEAPNPSFDYGKDPIMQQLYKIREERIRKGGQISEGKVGFKRDDVLEMASVIRSARR